MIDIKIQEELRNKYNPDGSLLRAQQMRMLEILSYIDNICKNNNITYWLSSGTLLGAVRHEGFIPWDDDLDIEMLEDDFNKFKEVMLKEEGKFKLQIHETDPSYLAPYAKVRDLSSYLKEENSNDLYYKYHGIYVDVFCLEPNNSIILTKLSGTIQYILFTFNRIPYQNIRKPLVRFTYGLAYKCIFPILKVLSSIRNKEQLRHIHGSAFWDIRNKSDLYPIRKLKFENKYFPCPNNSHNVLTKIYGDYMQLPNDNQIKPHWNKLIIYDK